MHASTWLLLLLCMHASTWLLLCMHAATWLLWPHQCAYGSRLGICFMSVPSMKVKRPDDGAVLPCAAITPCSHSCPAAKPGALAEHRLDNTPARSLPRPAPAVHHAMQLCTRALRRTTWPWPELVLGCRQATQLVGIDPCNGCSCAHGPCPTAWHTLGSQQRQWRSHNTAVMETTCALQLITSGRPALQSVLGLVPARCPQHYDGCIRDQPPDTAGHGCSTGRGAQAGRRACRSRSQAAQ
jgi:hypothetical protein